MLISQYLTISLWLALLTNFLSTFVAFSNLAIFFVISHRNSVFVFKIASTTSLKVLKLILSFAYLLRSDLQAHLEYQILRFTNSWKNFSPVWPEFTFLYLHLKVWTHYYILSVLLATFLMKSRQNIESIWNYFLELNSNFSLSVAKATTFTTFFEFSSNLWR